MSMTTELIDRLRTNVNWLDDEDNDEREIRRSMLEAADTIQLLSEKLHNSQMERSSQYYNGGWIPCEDRLPEEDGAYLVTAKNLTGYLKIDYEVFECMFFCKDWQFKEWSANKILAWMPKPRPYQPKEGKK